jgi:hypothetical protein
MILSAKKLTSMMLSFTFNCSSKKGRSVSFVFGRIGAPAYDKRFGTELHFDPDLLLDAAFYARENGAKYLRRVPINTVIDKLPQYRQFFHFDNWLINLTGKHQLYILFDMCISLSNQ